MRNSSLQKTAASAVGGEGMHCCCLGVDGEARTLLALLPRRRAHAALPPLPLLRDALRARPPPKSSGLDSFII